MAAEEQRVESVERALTLLNAFEPGTRGMTLAALSTKTQLYKSTILRLIASLERFGYVTRADDGTYRLGPAVWTLAQAYNQSFGLEEAIRPRLRALVEATGETAAFFVRSGQQRVCLYRENSRRPIRHHLDEGVLLPLDLGASGRVLLAFTGTEGEPYETIRKDRVYVSQGERDPDVAAVAVPVVGRAGQFLGALAVSALRSRLTDDKVAESLQELRVASQSLSADID
jgi:DNA-binding IclR family transcriptional regulator